MHEHPAKASSWGLDEIKEMPGEEGIITKALDQCMYGLFTWSVNGKKVKTKKPTKFMTNSTHVAMRLGKLCDGKH